MKTIIKFLSNIFSSIKKVLDKIIFLPISKIVYFVTSKFDKPNKRVEVSTLKKNSE